MLLLHIYNERAFLKAIWQSIKDTEKVKFCSNSSSPGSHSNEINRKIHK